MSFLRPTQFVLLLGDAIIFYGALFLTLILRYGMHIPEILDAHLVPFTWLLPVWLVTFYVAGLYDPRRLQNGVEFLKTLSLALGAAAVLSIIFFYLLPVFTITPKRTLALFILLSAFLHVVWRDVFNRLLGTVGTPAHVVVLGESAGAAELVAHLEKNHQLGYEVVSWIKNGSLPKNFPEADAIICPREFVKESRHAKQFYALFAKGIEIYDIPHFYELVMRKVPLAEVQEEWFVEHIARPRPLSDSVKRPFEFILALILGLLLLPLGIVIGLLVTLGSPGPMIYRQTRVGYRGREFTLYKFRTMRENAEKNGPQWATQGDTRSTPMGRILRATHLDELPQLWNILKGDLAFVGPRPERPEFVALLEEKIPFYQIRHTVPPGLTGWAQVNYPYGASVEDAYRKLEFEIFYIKHRSLLFDLAIMLKTIRLFFVTPKRKP